MAPLSALRSLSLALLCATSALSSPVSDTPAAHPLAPSDDATRRNAFSIFNAVHSAMRQWGSSLNHNGMSLFLATVPEGQLFYHGGDEPERSKGLFGRGLEWLAFELEHAQMFAMSRPGRRRLGEGDPPAESTAQGWDMWSAFYESRLGSRSFAVDTTDGGQKTLGGGDDDDDDKPKRPDIPDIWDPIRGYFHTYRANRPLNLLYIDGMAAGKSVYGCLDTQDLLLLDWIDDANRCCTSAGEIERSKGLCDLAKAWAWDGGQIDGFIRTEAGFEIIYCDFSEGGGLDVVSIQPSPFSNETGGLPVFAEAEFLRGVSLRYHGQPAGRIYVDWSSMVSAFFYDVNLTNPDAGRPELPRLANVARDERRGIRARLQEVVAARAGVSPQPPGRTVQWQGIVDLIVTRFSGRLQQLARDTSDPITSIARQVLPTFLYPYLNVTNPAEPHALQLDRCAKHYLAGALDLESTWTPEDRSIYIAVETVTRTICSSLFAMRSIIYDDAANTDDAYDDTNEDSDDDTDDDGDDDKEAKLLKIVEDLMEKLQWTTWRECDPCQHPDEMCLVAMFPWGDADDHFHPRCKRTDNLQTRNSYWRKGWLN